LGECFDKTAKLLGLSYPGGPAVEKAAMQGDEDRFALPMPLRGQKNCDFSFSGLKTAIRQTAIAEQPLSDQTVSDLCASFEKAVVKTLKERLSRGLERFNALEDLPMNPSFVVAGGVAANKKIRMLLNGLCAEYKLGFVAPPHHLCTDNASMIAWAGAERMALGLEGDPMHVAPRSRWPLDENAVTKIGSGRRGAKA
jgi:N6-L-threonylcarbamoyladenine synthase